MLSEDDRVIEICTSDLNEVIPLCYLNIYFITIYFRQHN